MFVSLPQGITTGQIVGTSWLIRGIIPNSRAAAFRWVKYFDLSRWIDSDSHIFLTCINPHVSEIPWLKIGLLRSTRRKPHRFPACFHVAQHQPLGRWQLCRLVFLGTNRFQWISPLWWLGRLGTYCSNLNLWHVVTYSKKKHIGWLKEFPRCS